MKPIKPRILLVEDLDANRATTMRLLQEQGYEVIPAASKEEACQVLDERLVHLAVVDVRMKDADENDTRGLDFCREMRADIPRILFTAYPNWEVVRTLSELSVESLVDKGAKSEVLLGEIHSVLTRFYDVIPARRLGILTSGGDAPGMNAAIWSALRTALAENVEMFAIYDGYEGLIHDRVKKLRWPSVADTLTTGGTMLGTARSQAFKDKGEKREIAADNLVKRHIDGLIVIGGDGSMRGAQKLAEVIRKRGAKLDTIALPGTIDNDLDGTEMSIGAASAVAAGMHEINSMVAPARALRRVFVCEVMGRHSGFLTLEIGLCVGADAILLPEELVIIKGSPKAADWKDHIDFSATRRRVEDEIGDVSRKLEQTFASGKRHAFVLFSEGIRLLATDKENHEYVKLEDIARTLRQRIGEWKLTPEAEVRSQVIGYPMRGASPSRFDIHLGTTLGSEAVRMLLDGKSELMLGWSDKGAIQKTSFDTVVERSNRSPVTKYKDRRDWRRTVELQRRLVKPLPKLL